MSGSLGGYFNLGGDGGQGLGLNLSRFGRQVAEGVNKIVDNLVTEGQYYQGGGGGSSCSPRRNTGGVSSSSSSTTTFSGEGGGDADRAGARGRGGQHSAATTPGDEASSSSRFEFVNDLHPRHRGQPTTSSGGAGPSSTSARRASASNPTASTSSGTTSSEGMSCDYCNAKFALFSRKRTCEDCKGYFCSDHVSRENTNSSTSTTSIFSNNKSGHRICVRCKVLNGKPPCREDLMELRVKDLRRFLGSKQVNTSSCVEKKDLVELVVRHNGGIPSNQQPFHINRRRDPVERNQRPFPSNYSESTHRRDWLEKLDRGGGGDEDEGGPEVGVEAVEDTVVEDFVVIPSPERDAPQPQPEQEDETMSVSETNRSHSDINTEAENTVQPEATLVEDFTDENESGEVLSSRLAGAASSNSSATAGGGGSAEVPIPAAASAENVAASSAPSDRPPFLNPGFVDSDLSKSATSSPSSSRRKFANKGLVYLNELESAQDMGELSVKQIKDILAMNRVNFKGVVEKAELLKILERLWKQEQRLKDEKDTMDDEDLCKICMDLPVDCVMLECGHMCTCINCGKQLAECPICRQYVVRVVKTFKA